MKLATFDIPTALGPARRIGAVVDSHVIDLRAAYAAVLTARYGHGRAAEVADAVIGSSMIDFLRGGEHAREAAYVGVEHAASGGDAELAGQRLTYRLDDVRLCAPIPRPNSLRDCTGFRAHLEEFFAKVDLPDPTAVIFRDRPMYYKANADMVLGPDEVVPWSGFSATLDFEIEPMAVIGTFGENVSVDDAERYIAGYTILNDFSLRDYQLKEMAIPVNLYGVSKSKDAGTYPMGPWIVTPDEVDITKSALVVRVNGEEWVRESMTDMTWSFAEIVAFSSIDEPLFPGDCLAGGAPPRGCGADVGRWISPGDVVECEIEGIGVLRNTVGERRASSSVAFSAKHATPAVVDSGSAHKEVTS